MPMHKPISGEKIVGMFREAQSARSNWESHWQAVADLMMPTRQFTTKREKGARLRNNIFDATAGTMLLQLAAGTHGLLVNPATKWIAIRAAEDEVNEDEESRLWMDRAANRMLRMFAAPQFGFATQSQEIFQDLYGFGTAAMLLYEQPDRLRFSARPLSEVFLEGDDDFNVRSVYAVRRMTPEQVVERFGADSLSDDLKRKWRDGKREKVEIVNYVTPRNERDPRRADSQNKPFASFWVEVQTDHVLRESGFDEFPYLVPRLFKGSGEVYGRGLGMMALPDASMVNAMAETNIVALQKAIDPPMMVDANAIEGPIETDPGSIIYRRAGTRNTIEQLQLTSRPELGDVAIQRIHEKISQIFFMDKMQLPQLDRMTATEVIQRVQQQLVFLSPIVARIQNEWLDPLVGRTLRFMLNNRMFDEPPDLVAQLINDRNLGAFEIDFTSMMALSQRASEAMQFDQWFQQMIQVSQVDPSVMDRIDPDEFSQYSGLTWHNVPRRLMRNDDDISRIRQKRAEDQARVQEAQIAATEAEAAERGSKAVSNIAGSIRP